MTKTLKPNRSAAPAAPMPDLIAITQDPADAMRLAADLFATTFFRAQRVMAAAAGLPNPRAPKPRSRYLRAFIAGVTAKVDAIGRLFDRDDLERMKRMGPAIVQRLERNDSDLIEEVLKIICMEPEEAVKWIREHLDEIEARLAS
jgi:hypothetical protein